MHAVEAGQHRGVVVGVVMGVGTAVRTALDLPVRDAADLKSPFDGYAKVLYAAIIAVESMPLRSWASNVSSLARPLGLIRNVVPSIRRLDPVSCSMWR